MHSLLADIEAEERLGGLAMEFRGTRSTELRREIADQYASAVDRLIRSGHWCEMPAPEDQLPDAWMPQSFFEYWSRRTREAASRPASSAVNP